MNETVARTINNLSELIMQSAQRMESERHTPVPDADRMCDLIEFHGERVRTLRKLRDTFEDEMAKPSP